MIKKGSLSFIYRFYELNLTIVDFKKVGIRKWNEISLRNFVKVYLLFIVEKRLNSKIMDMIFYLITNKKTATW